MSEKKSEQEEVDAAIATALNLPTDASLQSIRTVLKQEVYSEGTVMANTKKIQILGRISGISQGTVAQRIQQLLAGE